VRCSLTIASLRWGWPCRRRCADLDGVIPQKLVAYDTDGAAIATTDITSTGGALLGYLLPNG